MGIAVSVTALSLGGCSGYSAGWSDIVYVGSDRVKHETFTWRGPIGEAYKPNDQRIGRVGPGKICDMARVVDKPNFDEVFKEDGTPMHKGAFQRSLFKECLEPGKDTQ